MKENVKIFGKYIHLIVVLVLLITIGLFLLLNRKHKEALYRLSNDLSPISAKQEELSFTFHRLLWAFEKSIYIGEPKLTRGLEKDFNKMKKLNEDIFNIAKGHEFIQRDCLALKDALSKYYNEGVIYYRRFASGEEEKEVLLKIQSLSKQYQEILALLREMNSKIHLHMGLEFEKVEYMGNVFNLIEIVLLLTSVLLVYFLLRGYLVTPLRELLDLQTERLKENQQVLIQSEKMASIGQLAAGVAHEINNPIAFIKCNLGFMNENIETLMELIGKYEKIVPENCSDNVEIMKEIADLKERDQYDSMKEDFGDLFEETFDGIMRVQDIVLNLKTFARVDQDEVDQVDLNECIETTLKIVWNELKYKCDIEKNFNELIKVKCNPGQLNQVFMNILVNAAQAIEEKGKITIATKSEDGKNTVIISDTGPGIAPENMKKIFDPFFTTKRTGEGTGLGLSICHSIVEKHEGSIEVESEVGSGTTFTISIPNKE